MGADESPNRTPLELRAFIDAMPAFAWSTHPDGVPEFVNQRLLDYSGLSPETHYTEYKSIIHRDDLEDFENWWQALMNSKKPGKTELRLRRSDGEYRWFEVSATPVHDEQGNLIRWYGINIDIDERKRAEQKLRASEENLRTITDAIRQFIVVLAPDGTTSYANKVALENIGFTIRDLTDEGLLARAGLARPADAPGELAWNQVWRMAAHPDDRDRIQAERQKGLSQGTPFDLEARLLFKNGQYRWQLFQYNPLKGEDGQTIRWYVTATDIDDRKRTEEQLRNENLLLREEIDRSSMFEDIVGCSKPILQLLKHVERVAPADSTVLILGETGTGKELVARALHKRSKRATRTFVRINCAAIPESLIASELFGHEKGAFTGALQRRLGRFEAADGGTLFLDEIGELPMETQISLLRVLQEREFERVGSNHPISVDVRLIAATNRDLSAAVAAGTFRQDLFYRLNVFPIEVPPLRERREDIPLLVEYFVDRYAGRTGKKITGIGRKSMELLQSYKWPGNIRELQNVIERSVIICDSESLTIDESWLVRHEDFADSATQPLFQRLARQEKELIESALAESNGRVSGPLGAAAKLGIPESTLDSKIKALKINKHGFRKI